MFLLNGQNSNSLAITDRGLHYGDGLFETLEVIQGTPLFLSEHLQRLHDGCLRLKIPPFATQLLRDEVEKLSQNQPAAVIKIMVTRGSGGRGYRQPEPITASRILGVYPYPQYPQHYREDGVAVTLCQHPVSINPHLAGIKHLNRLDQVLARAEWQDDLYQEGLMTDSQGFLVEGTMTNLFWVRDNIVYTPDLAQAGINGIVRQWLIAHCLQSDIPLICGQFTMDDLRQADEIWLTNSLIGIWPVQRIQQQYFVPGPVTRAIQSAWQQARDRQLSC